MLLTVSSLTGPLLDESDLRTRIHCPSDIVRVQIEAMILDCALSFETNHCAITRCTKTDCLPGDGECSNK